MKGTLLLVHYIKFHNDEEVAFKWNECMNTHSYMIAHMDADETRVRDKE